MKDLLVSIVTVGNSDILIKCIKSIYQNTHGISFDIYVIDNTGTNTWKQIIKEKFPDVRVLTVINRQGFSSNHNLVIKNFNNYCFTLILNDDVFVLPNALNTLVNCMKKEEGVGIGGCKLLNPDNSLQPCCGMFPTLETMFYDLFGIKNLLSNITRVGKYIKNYIDYSRSQYVNWVSGCCMIIRKKALKEIGMLDSHFFLYCEDIDYCFRAYQKKWKVKYFPEAQIIHYEGSSTIKKNSKRIYKSNIALIRAQSRLYFFKKNYKSFQYNALKILYHIHLLFVYIKWKFCFINNYSNLCVEKINYCCSLYKYLKKDNLHEDPFLS